MKKQSVAKRWQTWQSRGDAVVQRWVGQGGMAEAAALTRGAVAVDAVVIGRNEGARLMACLASLQGRVRRLVYVDSGSTDGSVQVAAAAGARVVALDMTQPFTAARARNAGLAALAEDPPQFVQFVDGDCQVQSGWFDVALAAFASHPAAVVVCGRRREINPGASVYNALADHEWDTPIGPALACGGDALMRLSAVQAVGGYNPALIAGEEPELCLRLRAKGGEVWRIAAEMTRHDANMTRFGQWWKRSVRAGHAYAEGVALQGWGHWGVELRRALIWGAALPLLVVGAGLIHPAGWLLALAVPLQMLRLSRRGGVVWGVFTVLGKPAEAQGAFTYYFRRLQGRKPRLIEYK